MSATAERILEVVRSIPSGQTMSYGQVAARAGLKGRARLVAWALKQIPIDEPVPWHRVIRSDGRIAFPVYSQSFRLQARRLQAENVKIKNGRVITQSIQSGDSSLDQMLWGPEH